MSAPDLRAQLLLTPAEVAILFRHEGDLKWVYRNARRGRFLASYARRFNGKLLLFDKFGIERLIAEKGT